MSSAISSGLIPIFNQAKLSLQNRRYNGRNLNDFNGVKVVVPSRRLSLLSFGRILRGGFRKSCVFGFVTKYVVRMGRDSYQSSFDDDFRQEPFPLTLVNEFIWGIRSLLVFLVEQPSQLKYIEWPVFSSTLSGKMLIRFPNHFDATEDCYSGSCSRSAADCGTSVDRLRP